MNLEFFDHFMDATGMFVVQPKWDQVVTFLQGVDYGSDGFALLGFQEWIFTKMSERYSTGWPGAVVQHAIRLLQRPIYPLQNDDSDFLVQQLFKLLREYLHDRKQDEGLKKIFVRYQRMIEGCDSFLPECDGVD